MLTVTVIQKTRAPISASQIVAICKLAARFEKKIKGEIEITVVTAPAIRKLNKVHRGIDKVTDVLSFAWQEDAIIKTPMLGELYIAPEKIRSQAKEFGVSTKEEFVRMLVHGLLHLVGHDHMKEKEAARMFSLQEKIVKRAKQ